MGKDYEVGSEAPDIIYCTADNLLWEWDEEFSQLDLPLEFNLSDIEIIEAGASDVVIRIDLEKILTAT